MREFQKSDLSFPPLLILEPGHGFPPTPARFCPGPSTKTPGDNFHAPAVLSKADASSTLATIASIPVEFFPNEYFQSQEDPAPFFTPLFVSSRTRAFLSPNFPCPSLCTTLA